jgi:DME family drug/metabolite transporter
MLYTAPAFVAVLSLLLFKEPLPPAKIGLISLTIAGVAILSLSQLSQPSQLSKLPQLTPALAWGLLSGMTYALYYIFGKYILPTYQAVTVMALALPAGALGLLPFFSFASRPWPAWLAVIILALFSTYLAYQLYYAGLRRLEASRAVIVASIEPVVAAALAALVYGEQLSVGGYVGALLVVGSAIASSLVVQK